jgi:hypothetical protein
VLRSARAESRQIIHQFSPPASIAPVGNNVFDASLFQRDLDGWQNPRMGGEEGGVSVPIGKIEVPENVVYGFVVIACVCAKRHTEGHLWLCPN